MPAASVGDHITVVVKRGPPELRKQTFGAVIIRQKYPVRRVSGQRIVFEDNAAVIITPEGDMKGTDIKGPVAAEDCREMAANSQLGYYDSLGSEIIALKRSSMSAKPGKVRKSLLSGKQFEKSSSNLRAALSTSLKSKYTKNSLRVRPGDSVKLFRGEYLRNRGQGSESLSQGRENHDRGSD